MARLARRVLVLAAIVAIVAGVWMLQQLGPSTDEAVGSADDVGLTLYSGDRGVPAPEVGGETIDGANLDLADLKGHVIVLNVWGSWCAPCRAEAPDLATVSEETEARGVRFVGIDVRENPAAARAFTRKYGITYPSWNDQNGLVLVQFSGIIPVGAVPSTLVIDANGLIRARVVGRVEASTLRGLIEEAENAS